ncbi:MAG: PTS sugar transporter subunit IIA [Proteobacteria bacterium]|nr:MAG: PTS sugar transporter subunit IIA [Pseudomonadota bacterium]
MEMRDLLAPANVIVGLRQPDKAKLLGELAERAAGALKLEPARIVQALIKREDLGSTGMGGGVAIPHARIAGVKAPFGILACTRKPIAFEAVDGQPVDVCFMLLLPENPVPEHLAALALVARALRNPTTVQALRAARDNTDAHRCLVDSKLK